MNFSEKLKIIRRDSGMKLSEISKLAGISLGLMKHYSAGIKNPKIDKIQKIADIPELEPWREFLLDQSEKGEVYDEIMILAARVRKEMGDSAFTALLEKAQREKD